MHQHTLWHDKQILHNYLWFSSRQCYAPGSCWIPTIGMLFCFVISGILFNSSKIGWWCCKSISFEDEDEYWRATLVIFLECGAANGHDSRAFLQLFRYWFNTFTLSHPALMGSNFPGQTGVSMSMDDGTTLFLDNQCTRLLMYPYQMYVFVIWHFHKLTRRWL